IYLWPLCHMYHHSYALCVRYDGTEVDDSYCDSVTRPEPTHEFCTGKECPPRWETSGWSECSRTCGEGFQYRTVRCWKMLSTGLDSSVYDSLCLSHDLHKPANRKVCLGPELWAPCSARCGSRGVRTREVQSQQCEGPPCDRRWTVSDWGPCSGVCGEGRMVRAVMCRSSGGMVMSEEQCDQSLRPLAIYPCGDRDCAPHWLNVCVCCVVSVMLHVAVVCDSVRWCVPGWKRSVQRVPDSSWDQTNKPETASSCFKRPCSKWFTTSWSQVSIPQRSHGNALNPQGLKNLMTLSCQDKPTANCALVLKVKLCSHWYYRKACCQSCKAPRA
uniref:PLAC domain-containing protein n=1 Tax=Sphaeramia orbicularis TaxID=375764 RepID=A0A673CG78_9TELE